MARKISRNEGFLKLVFSRGLAVTLLRAIPVNGTVFCAYEFVSHQLQKFDYEKRSSNNDHDLVTTCGDSNVAIERSDLSTNLGRKLSFTMPGFE